MDLRSKTKMTDESWNEFFSRLAFAEKAAADQCRVISKMLESNGETALAKSYEGFAKEEEQHFNLVKQICSPLQTPTEAAARVFNGSCMNKTTNPLERMANVHLVFEPAALAFLGFLHQNAHNLINDSARADQIKNAMAEILQDEVGHVYEGKGIIQNLLKRSSAEDISITRKAMRKHRTFIIAGIKSMFKTNPKSKELTQAMLSRFDFYLNKASDGVFA